MVNVDVFIGESHMYNNLCVTRDFLFTTEGTTREIELAKQKREFTAQLKEHRLSLWPMHIHNNHWILAVINNPMKLVTIYDSLRNDANDVEISKNIRYSIVMYCTYSIIYLQLVAK